MCVENLADVLLIFGKNPVYCWDYKFYRLSTVKALRQTKYARIWGSFEAKRIRKLEIVDQEFNLQLKQIYYISYLSITINFI